MAKPTEESRYLHLAGAFVAGGWFTGLGPEKANLAVPTVAPVHLPMVGGISEARIGEEFRLKRRAKTLLTVSSGYTKSETAPPDITLATSQTRAEARGLVVDGLSIDRAFFSLRLSHRKGTQQKPTQPSITFESADIQKLSLNGRPVRVTVDTSLYNKYPTLLDFEKAFQAGKLGRSLARTLATDSDGKLHRNSSGYVMGSVVSYIEEKDLPQGATVDANGYTISWPGFGKIILGEVTMGPYIRRVTLVRLKHSDMELVSGCLGGSYVP